MNPNDLIAGNVYKYDKPGAGFIEVMYSRTVVLPNNEKAFSFRTRTGALNLTKEDVERKIINKRPAH